MSRACAAHGFLDFVNASPSPFHAVNTAKQMLLARGFVQLSERESWKGKVARSGKYFVTRNGTALVAFAVGGKYEARNGFVSIGAHTDSPCPKVKPISKRDSHGYVQLGLELYGGGLWHTWFDRDLTIAGRVLIEQADGSVVPRLVHVKRPIMRIPTLAIHLDRDVVNGFKYNKEKHLAPVIATTLKEGLLSAAGESKSAEGADESGAASVGARHSAPLLRAVAAELGVSESAIQDFELCVVDATPATIGGVHEEFIFAPRLDNLMMCFTGLTALVDSEESLESDSCVRCVALFDNEEVGSQSTMGAASTLLAEVMRRVSVARSEEERVDADVLSQAAHHSLVVSADMAHAVHPNYPERHESKHGPGLHKGLVLKHNANQRYATNSVSAFFVRRAAAARGLPLQEFVVRQDMGCGSTIGPILATRLGVRTVDVGIPQLSMHSIREMCGTTDVDTTIELFKGLFEDYAKLDAMLKEEEE
mmetsp:Transcript_3069/g.9472  ORF Transcript_3069/g.9472 Transcript_3069/m.9472 type:complete len:478 (+) Transcript_3069:116-1549(+)